MQELAVLMHSLAEQLVVHIQQPYYQQFTADTFAMSSAVLAGYPIDPDELYGRLENLAEEDIFTYQALDTQTHPEVWNCIDEALALVCFLNYRRHGHEYLPQTLESIDEALVDDFFMRYRQLLRDLLVGTVVARRVRQDARVNLGDPGVRARLDSLFRPGP